MDPIANFLTSIRNANAKGHEKTDVPLSKLKMNLAKILKDEGYIQSFRTMEEHERPFLRIQLKYTDQKEAVIKGIKRISKPGLRVYNKWDEIRKVDGGMGISILSTPKGLMTNRKARQMKIGGEVLCNVW
jgi:small subunit ribosomal protein S8